MSHAVLVVDDEPDIRDVVRRYLERAGHEVLATGSGAHAIRLIEDGGVDLAVVDLGLPDVPGLDVVAAARERGIPAVVLTSRASTDDRIAGLESGADDYVTKPFSPRELALRVDAVLRRTAAGMPAAVASFGGGALRIDEERHQITVAGDPVDLTPTEWRLLEALSSRPGRVFSRYELVTRAAGYEFGGYERTIDSHIRNLRRKLRDDAARQRIVETVPGVGYRLGLSRDP
jgi:two-component system alkaline phosphatase synthesis response regulator PhoP